MGGGGPLLQDIATDEGQCGGKREARPSYCMTLTFLFLLQAAYSALQSHT